MAGAAAIAALSATPAVDTAPGPRRVAEGEGPAPEAAIYAAATTSAHGVAGGGASAPEPTDAGTAEAGVTAVVRSCRGASPANAAVAASATPDTAFPATAAGAPAHDASADAPAAGARGVKVSLRALASASAV